MNCSGEFNCDPGCYLMEGKLRQLESCLRRYAPMLIAYSGGVDSTYLLAFAHRILKGRMLGVIADSPSLPRKALADALALADRIGAPVEVLETQEMQDEQYVSNPMNRCYFCKAELFSRMTQLAADRDYKAIAYGENKDDANQIRPGLKAAVEFAVIAPLKDACLTKAEIRRLSAEMGLPTADAPAQPCLSSRIPHGTPVTREALTMVERGEAYVRSLGFRVFRVRHIVGESGRVSARVQIAPGEMSRLAEVKLAISGGLAAVGYSSTEIDPAGYRNPE
jgi:uncharacterized protein